MSSVTDERRHYIDLLPAVFKNAGDDFLERFLRIFEKILSGIDDGVSVDGTTKGISSILDQISDFFCPYPTEEFLIWLKSFCPDAPEEFLDWLSTWVGLVLKEDWPLARKRSVIARIILLYRMRGTRKGLEEFLNIYIEGGGTVRDNLSPFVVGVNCRVGETTSIGFPNFFIVETALRKLDINEMKRKLKKIEAIIDREKPVHTDYKINTILIESMQIDVHSTVEEDTLIWSYE